MADGAEQTDSTDVLASIPDPSAQSAYANPQAAGAPRATSTPDTTVPDASASPGDTGNVPAPQEQTAYQQHHPADAPAATSTPDTATEANPPASDTAANEYNLSRAAFICGATAHLGPRQQSDAELADFFGQSPSTIAANPTGFQRRYTIINSRNAMAGCTALPQFIAQNPQTAPQLLPHLEALSNYEKVLSSARGGAKESVDSTSKPVPHETTSESFLSSVWKYTKEVVEGIGEPVLHGVTATAAKFISDVYGLSAMGYELATGSHNTDQIDGFQRDIQNSLTYQPRSEAGRSPNNPLNFVPDHISKAIDYLRPDKPVDASTASGMTRNFLREAIPQILTLFGGKLLLGRGKVPEGEMPDTGGADVPKPPEGAHAPETAAPPKKESSPDYEAPPESEPFHNHVKIVDRKLPQE